MNDRIHPTSVISGFMLAQREALKYIEDNLSLSVSQLGKEVLINAAKTSMSSKIIHSQADFFAQMAVDAVSAVKTERNGKIRYPLKAISIIKVHGQGLNESERVNGFALNVPRAAQQMPSVIKNAKIALLDYDLRKTKMAFGVQVLVNDPRSLDAIREREADITKEKIDLLLKAGANVIFTTKGIDDMALKYFVDAGAIAARRCDRDDLKRLAKATGGSLILSFADAEGEESIDPSAFGEAEMVCQDRVGDDELLFIKGCKSTAAQTIVLRGANDFLLDEVERSLHDSLAVVKRTLESGSVVPGGGAVEAALSVYLEHLAETMSSREQNSVAEFAQALLVIPKTLAVNGAHDAANLTAQLRAHHNAAQTDKAKSNLKWSGLDLQSGKVRDSVAAGILEPALSKLKSIRFATEAAVTVLRIDDCIKLNAKEEPQGPAH